MNNYRITIRDRDNGDLAVTTMLPFNTSVTNGSKVVPSDKLLERLHQKHDTSISLLPPVVRWISPSRQNLILERPPMIRDIIYHGMKQDNAHRADAQEFSLPIPWTVYGISLTNTMRPHKIQVFASRGPIKDLEQELYLLPIPNVYKDGSVCGIATPEELAGSNESFTLSQGVSLAYEKVWGAMFNMDTIEAVKEAFIQERPNDIFTIGGTEPMSGSGRHSPARLVRRWHNFTLEEVLEWKDWPRPLDTSDENPYRFKHLVQNLAGLEGSFDARYFFNELSSVTK